jgi:hypothetical protein
VHCDIMFPRLLADLDNLLLWKHHPAESVLERDKTRRSGVDVVSELEVW